MQVLSDIVRASLLRFRSRVDGGRRLIRQMNGESEKSVRPKDSRRSSPVFVVLTLLLALTALSCDRTTAAVERPLPREASKPDTTRDSDSDGIPDAAELHSADDRNHFRQWFTAIAEMQFHEISDSWTQEQRDCAGLVRFAIRESLRRHDRAWFKTVRGLTHPVAPDVRAFKLDSGLLGEKLFRTDYGAFQESDLDNGKFSEFADARTLKNFNVTFISKDRDQAQAGDLLFFHQPWVQRFPFHVMIFLGEARYESENAHDWVVYHTGNAPHQGPARAAGANPENGVDEDAIRKVRLSVLDYHPNRKWRPVPQNPNFLGFFRLKILD